MPEPVHLERRLRCTALHEVGHTFGLPHCTDGPCPMQDAGGSIVNADTANHAFGPEFTAAQQALPIALP